MGDFVSKPLLFHEPRVRCKNHRCGYRNIVLPYPNLPKIFEGQSESDEDAAYDEIDNWPDKNWKETIACPSCGNVAAYEKQEVQWWLFAPDEGSTARSRQSDTICFCVKFRCGQQGCEAHVKFHVIDLSSAQEVYKNLKEGFFLGRCPNGHDFFAPPRERCDIYRVMGPI